MGDDNSASKGKKVSTGKGPPKRVVRKVAFFNFVDHTGKSADGEADPIDLKAAPLKIKQVVPFIPPKSGKGEAEDEAEAYLSVWELKGKSQSDEKASYEILRIFGKVSKSDGYNFRPSLIDGAVRIEQKEGDKYFFKQAEWAAKKTTTQFLKAKIECEALDGAKTTIEFVMPPLEYDEMLELQLGGGTVVGGKLSAHTEFAVGQCKVCYGTIDEDWPFAVQDDSAGMYRSEKSEKGNLNRVVVHCMCAINVVGDKPSKWKDVAENVKLLRDRYLSAHFIIGRDGKVHQCVDVHYRARHATIFNPRSIGIECIGFYDGQRKETEAAYKEAYKPLRTLKDKKAAIETKRAAHQAAKNAGKTKVKVGGKDVAVDQAIAACDAAIAELDSKIANFSPGPWAEDLEKSILTPTDPEGVPMAYHYTDDQYKSLGQLLTVLGTRFGYNVVASHHQLDSSRKTDPGIYFQWSQLTPYLLPGKLAGDEAHGGGKYTVG